MPTERVVVVDRFDELEQKMRRAAQQIARDIADRVLEEIDEHVPVEHGDLKRSITPGEVHEAQGGYEIDISVVGTKEQDKFAYVEYGTARMVAAHGPHDPNALVTSWEALRKRGGMGQTMPFARPAVMKVDAEKEAIAARNIEEIE